MAAVRTHLVFLVEDNPDDERLMVRALRKASEDSAFRIARDGAEAAEYLIDKKPLTADEPHLYPNLILLDLKLPKLGGLELLERIRGCEHHRFTPVIVLTSSDEAADIKAAYRLGANSYVRKPVDFDKFIETMNRISLYWLHTNIQETR